MSIFTHRCYRLCPCRAAHLSRHDYPLTPNRVVRGHEMLSKLFVPLDLYHDSFPTVPPLDRALLLYTFAKFVWILHVAVVCK